MPRAENFLHGPIDGLFFDKQNKKKTTFYIDFNKHFSYHIFNERGKAHRLPRLFENRRDEGRTGSGAR